MNAKEIRLQVAHCRDRADDLRNRAWLLPRANSYAVFTLALEWDHRADALEQRLGPKAA